MELPLRRNLERSRVDKAPSLAHVREERPDRDRRARARGELMVAPASMVSTQVPKLRSDPGFTG